MVSTLESGLLAQWRQLETRRILFRFFHPLSDSRSVFIAVSSAVRHLLPVGGVSSFHLAPYEFYGVNSFFEDKSRRLLLERAMNASAGQRRRLF